MTSPAMVRPRRSRGFTLFELVITVAIIGILAAIAYPAYTDSVLKGRRAEGRTALMELLQQQERFMTQRNTYYCFGASGCANTVDSARALFKVFSGDRERGAAYTLTAGSCDAPNNLIRDCVKLIATPAVADPAADKLWLTSLGEKSCDGPRKSVCWR